MAPNASSPGARVRAEHRELEDRLSSLGRLIQRDAGQPAGTRIIADLTRHISDLQMFLARHFAWEEESGFVETATSEAPELVRRAATLLADHNLLCDSMDEIASDLIWADSAEGWQRVRREVADLIERIQEHETRENRLIADALLEDHGGG